MARRERIRARGARGDGQPDTDPLGEPLPRRPVADTSPAAQLLDRIRRLLRDAPTRNEQSR